MNKKYIVLRLLLVAVFPSIGMTTQAQIRTPDTVKNNVDTSSRKHPFGEKINVAYGQQYARALTSAISTVNSTVLRKTPATTLSNTLYGRLPGLTMLQGSGEPGYDAPSAMLIRGNGTFQNSGFPVFVDGFESSLDQLAVDEVETVSVLKDAAALALYGIRGANGAIIVTTKRGQAGKTKITFNAQTGLQKPTQLPDFVGSYDYARLYNQALTNDGLPSRYSPADLDAYQSGSDPYLHPDVNWYDEVLRKNAPFSNYNLSFSGGGNNAKYFILLGYMNSKGLYANTDEDRAENSNADYNRYNFRSNIDLKLNKIVSASFDIGGRVEDRFFPNYNGTALWENMAKYPANAYPVRNPNNSWGGNGIYRDNPVASVLGGGWTSSNDRNLNATMRLTEDLGFLLKGLTFNQAFSLNNWYRANRNRTRSIGVYELSGTETDYTYRQHGTTSDFAVNRSGNDQWNRTNFQTALNYDRHWNNHEFSGMLMYHQDVYKVSGNEVPYATQNLAGRLNYSYKSKYFTELGFSYSGSENFPAGNRFGFFPTLSAAWILSEEDFLKNSSAINFLKVRGSAGLVGNDRLVGSRFAYAQNYFYSGGYNFGQDNTSYGVIMEGPLGNPNLSWEKSMKYNLGLEGNVLKKVDFSLDLFYENRKDILATNDAVVPSYVGVGMPYQNLGRVSNRGFEFDLKYTDQIGDFNYFIKAGAFYAQNKILEMSEVIRAEDYLYRTGHQVGQPFGLEALGFFKDQNDIDNSPLQTFTPVKPGDLKYKDQNGDHVINENDEIAIGKGWTPQITYTATLGANYKGFDLELFFQGITRRNVYLSGTYFWALQNDANIPELALNSWTPETSGNATYPRLSTLPNANNYRPSTFWAKSGGVLRLRNVELGYTFPTRLLSKARISNVRTFVSAVNAFTWDKIKSVDPESLTGYPPLKSFNVGINVQF
ncbi:TonB-dependent receptor [Pedobacter sp. B4-66]|uniref:SusC/RagA family TonB-linked outer membrane protein n=1 Tax=Pedobacter sp. B4-66 TaxID=2817280 RepID=UPI001BDB1F9E|nr:TonB-dependent receptor [Pedobacter sp. B4-66]